MSVEWSGIFRDFGWLDVEGVSLLLRSEANATRLEV
jgi:hypothetical protein